MNLSSDFFTLFGLAPRFCLDPAELDARYLELQGMVHPDRFARAAEHERRLSMQWAARVNEAYLTLKKPLERAQYLLRQAGYDPEAKESAGMDADFLMEQMTWREAVQDARQDANHRALKDLHHRLDQDLRRRYAALAALLDDTRDFEAARVETRRLMFLEKLRADIDDALAVLEDDGMNDGS
jgi:molecular chaperone HscB